MQRQGSTFGKLAQRKGFRITAIREDNKWRNIPSLKSCKFSIFNNIGFLSICKQTNS